LISYDGLIECASFDLLLQVLIKLLVGERHVLVRRARVKEIEDLSNMFAEKFIESLKKL
jgi:hypothetical protein